MVTFYRFLEIVFSTRFYIFPKYVRQKVLKNSLLIILFAPYSICILLRICAAGPAWKIVRQTRR